MTTTTHKVAGYEFTLIAGVRYWASRPMARRGMRVFPVTISPLGVEAPSVTVEDLTYDQANELLNAFNDGPTSFDGRVW